MFIDLSCSPASYQVLGAVPLGEGVADKPTKRRESALLAGTIRGATWLGSGGGGRPSLPSYKIEEVQQCQQIIKVKS